MLGRAGRRALFRAQRRHHHLLIRAGAAQQFDQTRLQWHAFHAMPSSTRELRIPRFTFYVMRLYSVYLNPEAS